MEINYLFKRIEFLEKGISLLLSEHQLKGIYLSQVSLTQAHKDYRKQHLRERVVKYLDKKIREARVKKKDNSEKDKER